MPGGGASTAYVRSPEEASDVELPGMWEFADLSEGRADSEDSLSQSDDYKTINPQETHE
jgi:hypothetical protein